MKRQPHLVSDFLQYGLGQVLSVNYFRRIFTIINMRVSASGIMPFGEERGQGQGPAEGGARWETASETSDRDARVTHKHSIHENEEFQVNVDSDRPTATDHPHWFREGLFHDQRASWRPCFMAELVSETLLDMRSIQDDEGCLSIH